MKVVLCNDNYFTSWSSLDVPSLNNSWLGVCVCACVRARACARVWFYLSYESRILYNNNNGSNTVVVVVDEDDDDNDNNNNNNNLKPLGVCFLHS